MADTASISKSADGKFWVFTGLTGKQRETLAPVATLRDGATLTATITIDTPPPVADPSGRVWTVTSVNGTGFTAQTPV